MEKEEKTKLIINYCSFLSKEIKILCYLRAETSKIYFSALNEGNRDICEVMRGKVALYTLQIQRNQKKLLEIE